MKVKVKFWLGKAKRNGKIRAHKLGTYLVDNSLKFFSVNVYTGEMKEHAFKEHLGVLLSPDELPVKALSRERAIKKANALLKKHQAHLPSHQIVFDYAH